MQDEATVREIMRLSAHIKDLEASEAEGIEALRLETAEHQACDRRHEARIEKLKEKNAQLQARLDGYWGESDEDQRALAGEGDKQEWRCGFCGALKGVCPGHGAGKGMVVDGRPHQ